MTKPAEYEFTLPDGSKRYEIVSERSDAFQFQKMHKATTFKPVDAPDGWEIAAQHHHRQGLEGWPQPLFLA